MSAINYSKWDHIEISDDEDDTHPNIDTPSLFRWRHQARMERMAETQKEKDTFQKQHQSHQQKMQEIKQKLKETEDQTEPSQNSIDQMKAKLEQMKMQDQEFEKKDKKALQDLETMKAELEEMEKEEESFKKKEEELNKKERLTPWNIDTICHDGKSKTVINKITKKDDKELTDDERAEKQASFSKDHKAEIKKYGMYSKYDDSQEYLSKNLHLVCEETANYLVLWCIDLEIEEKHGLMEQVAHQTIVMQFILELAKQTEVDPRSCVRPFFSRIKLAHKEYMDAFNDELNGFKQRIRTRAKQKIDEAIKEHEEEEKQKRLGPGGLDPLEVFETLPDTMKECFESKDISQLQKVVLDMSKEDAEYHMKRCIDSGLWVPNAKDAEGDSHPVQEEGGQEETYEEVH